jgi:hypothetical protein
MRFKLRDTGIACHLRSIAKFRRFLMCQQCSPDLVTGGGVTAAA